MVSRRQFSLIEPRTSASRRRRPDRLRALAAMTELVWVAGNHDELTGQGMGQGDRRRALRRRHHAAPQCCPGRGAARDIGAFPPQAAAPASRPPRLAPLFAHDAKRLILPAFGSLTGGLDVFDPTIAAKFRRFYHAALNARKGRSAGLSSTAATRDDATANKGSGAIAARGGV